MKVVKNTGRALHFLSTVVCHVSFLSFFHEKGTSKGTSLHITTPHFFHLTPPPPKNPVNVTLKWTKPPQKHDFVTSLPHSHTHTHHGFLRQIHSYLLSRGAIWHLKSWEISFKRGCQNIPLPFLKRNTVHRLSEGCLIYESKRQFQRGKGTHLNVYSSFDVILNK